LYLREEGQPRCQKYNKSKFCGASMPEEKFSRTLSIFGLGSEKQVYNPSEEKFSADEAELLALFGDQQVVDEIIKMALAGELNSIRDKTYFK
jgi:hypothetical protein